MYTVVYVELYSFGLFLLINHIILMIFNHKNTAKLIVSYFLYQSIIKNILEKL